MRPPAPSPPTSCGIAPSLPGPCSAPCWMGPGFMSARRSRATRRKPPSPHSQRHVGLPHEAGGVKQPAVFTIAPSAPFAETLARGLIARAGDDPLALSSAVLLPPPPPPPRHFRAPLPPGRGGAAPLCPYRPPPACAANHPL